MAVAATSRQRQRGAAAVFVAISLIALLASVALAIDTGRLYNAQRNLQRLADLAAMDAARVAGGCLSGGANFDAAESEALASLARNGAPENLQIRVLAGSKAWVDDRFEFRASDLGAPRDSVQVTLGMATPSRLLALNFSDKPGKLLARSAAQSSVLATTAFQPTVFGLEGDSEGQLFAGLFPLNVRLLAGGRRLTAETDVEVRKLVAAQVVAGIEYPDLQTPVRVAGLLNAIAAALDQQGDALAASAVRGYGDTVAAGVEVVPAEVLGISAGTPMSLVSNATVNTGAVLAAVSSQLSTPGPIRIADLPPPLDFLNDRVEVELTPQPSRPGSYTPSFTDVSLETQEAAASVGGVLRLRVRLVNPLNGEPLAPLSFVVDSRGESATVTDVECARRGVPLTRVLVRGNSRGISFGVGGTVAGATPDLRLGLDPVELLSIPLDELLGAAPDGLPSLPISLPPGLSGQRVRVSLQPSSVHLGGRDSNLCFEGPAWGRPVQCDGSPARIGGISSRELVEALPALIDGVRLQVSLPPGLPAALSGTVNSLVQPLLSKLNQQLLGQFLEPLAAQILPLLRAANLSVGDTEFWVVAVTAGDGKSELAQPVIYAR